MMYALQLHRALSDFIFYDHHMEVWPVKQKLFPIA
jgi:hypothetical protein